MKKKKLKIKKKFLEMFEKGLIVIETQNEKNITEILKNTGYVVCKDNTEPKFIYTTKTGLLKRSNHLDGLPSGMDIVLSSDFFKKKKSNKKLKKRVQRLEAKYLQLKNIMLSKQDSSKTEHTEHLTEEQTEAVGKTVETEEKEIEWVTYLQANGKESMTIHATYKATKYANEETPVIEKL